MDGSGAEAPRPYVRRRRRRDGDEALAKIAVAPHASVVAALRGDEPAADESAAPQADFRPSGGQAAEPAGDMPASEEQASPADLEERTASSAAYVRACLSGSIQPPASPPLPPSHRAEARPYDAFGRVEGVAGARVVRRQWGPGLDSADRQRAEAEFQAHLRAQHGPPQHHGAGNKRRRTAVSARSTGKRVADSFTSRVHAAAARRAGVGR